MGFNRSTCTRIYRQNTSPNTGSAPFLKLFNKSNSLRKKKSIENLRSTDALTGKCWVTIELRQQEGSIEKRIIVLTHLFDSWVNPRGEQDCDGMRETASGREKSTKKATWKSEFNTDI